MHILKMEHKNFHCGNAIQVALETKNYIILRNNRLPAIANHQQNNQCRIIVYDFNRLFNGMINTQKKDIQLKFQWRMKKYNSARKKN